MALVLGVAAAIAIRQGMAGFDPDRDLWQQFAALRIDYVLLGLTCLGIFGFLTYLAGRFLTFMVLCLSCIYATYWWFVLGNNGTLQINAGTLFYSSIIYLTSCYAVASWLGIYESLRVGRARKRAMWVGLYNSAAFFVVLILLIRSYSPESGWYIYIALGILAGFFAVLAESIGSFRNYLFQLFTATSILLFNAALQNLLSEERLLLALAVECLVLAAAYHTSGIVVLKVLNLAALAVTVALALRATKLGGPVPVGGITLRENWLYGMTTCGLLVFAAYYYQRHIRSLVPQERKLSGHWFLADSFWDVPSSTAGLLHSAGAALIAIVLTIADFGDRPSLPYILAAESIAFAVLGFLLRLPQLEVSALMLIVATHVGYYFFLAIGEGEFADQRHFLLYTLLVLGYTYFLAHRWEKYLHGLQKGHPWEHYVSASIPYLIATAMLLSVLDWTVAGHYVPVAFGLAGVAFVLAGALTANAPIKTSGVAALVTGVAVYLDPFITKVTVRAAPLDGWGLPAAMLGLLLFAERALYWGRRTNRELAVAERLARTVLALLLAFTGFVSVRGMAPLDSAILAWLGLACLSAALGTVFRENRYRWMALLVLAGALAWTFGYERLPWAERPAKLLTFGSVGVVLLLAGSWGYTRRRVTDSPDASDLPAKGASADG